MLCSIILKACRWIHGEAESIRRDVSTCVGGSHGAHSTTCHCRSGSPPIAAVGASLVIREWTMPGPYYMHVHRSDDEAWHVLEGVLRFKFGDREVETGAGTTVFVPAGVAHTYTVVEPARYLIILTPKIDRLIGKLLDPAGVDDLRSTLGEFDTVAEEA
jgi:mannose-6-phosphate isomerase-like protein (cupin superfamily)